MAARKPLVLLNDGRPGQLPAGDTLIGGGGGSFALEIDDEGYQVTNAASKINFEGEFVEVSPQVSISEWLLLSSVTSMSDYSPPNPSSIVVKVYDSNVLQNLDCDSSVYEGAFVRMNGSSILVNAQADSMANAYVIGVVDAKLTSVKCNLRILGKCLHAFAGLNPTSEYWLSPTTPGGFTTTKPVTSGQVQLRLGQALSSTRLLFSKGERVEVP